MSTSQGPDPPNWLLEAALRGLGSPRREPYETQATNVLAFLLEANASVARRLLAHPQIGVGAQAQKAMKLRVLRERRLPGSSEAVDIEVIAVGAGDKPIARVWIEGKLLAREGRGRDKPRQFERYLDALHVEEAEAKKLVVVSKARRVSTKNRPLGFDVGTLYWREIADLIYEVGVEDYGVGWIEEAATASNATAGQRTLAECLWYLQKVLNSGPRSAPSDQLAYL